MPWPRRTAPEGPVPTQAEGPQPAREPFEHLFVVTYGRSGSTLVQGLLNALPGVLIRGENDFFLRGLFKSHEALSQVAGKWATASDRKGPASAFYGADQFDLEAFRDGIREAVDRQLLGHTDPADVWCLGFKEVLWHEIRPDETAPFLAFMDAVFPQARYVLHRRNHADVLVSGFWKRWDEEKAAKALDRVESLQDALGADRPDRVCWTSYEQITATDPDVSRGALARLAAFAGAEPSAELLDRLVATTRIGHGPNPRHGEKPARKATSA